MSAERLTMRQVAGGCVRSLRIGMKLGDGFREKARLTLFMLAAYVSPDPKAPLNTFFIRVAGMRFSVCISRARSELYALQDVFVFDQYAAGLPDTAAVVFDLGANVGYTTMYFRARYPDARIVAFEPDPINYSRLTANLEGVKGVECMRLAIGGTAGTIDFYVDPDLPMRSSMLPRQGAQRCSVEAITLSDALTRTRVDCVDVLKFDIEGAEADMFEHFTDWERVRFITGEVHTKLLGVRAAPLQETLKSAYDLTATPEGSYTMVHGGLRSKVSVGLRTAG